MISGFFGAHRFLSNFAPCHLDLKIDPIPGDFLCNGHVFASSEAAYQAAKCVDPDEAIKFLPMEPGIAKRFSRKIKIRTDWNEVKFHVMSHLVASKFMQNPLLANQLLATGDQMLVEDNHWGDTYWGVCKGLGDNNLGKILMEVRKNLRTVYKEQGLI